jgi:GT2 family glycosyltransferase
VSRCEVIIVNFNAGEFLTAAVESALRSRSVAHVYIVDNASTDGSLDFLPHGHDDRLTIINNTANLGFAAACNLGLMRTASENVLLLNPDCCVMEGAIDRLITALRSANHVGMVGPLLLNPDLSEQAGGRRMLPTPSLVLARLFGAARLHRLLPFRPPDFLLHKDPLPEGPAEVEAISGACMMVREEMITDIGPLDEGYFLHGEDLDWCMRAWEAGRFCSCRKPRSSITKALVAKPGRSPSNITSTLEWSGSIASCSARRGRAGSSHYWRPVFGQDSAG